MKHANRKKHGAFLVFCVSIFSWVLLSFLVGAPTVSREAAGVFSVAQREGVWWLMTPEGKPFFSVGVNVVNMGASRETYRAETPEYAAFRQYPTSQAWAEATLARLQAWNFNTLGAWSDVEKFEREGRSSIPYTIELGLGGATGAPWSDLFSDETAQRYDEIARRKILPVRDDPQLIGYFTDNELGWWDETIFYHVFKQPVGNATRQALMRVLRDHYRNRFSRLLRDFKAGAAGGFEDLEQGAQLKLRAGGRGAEAIEKFVSLVARRYYSLCWAAIRRYDRRHLILGDRYPGWFSPAAARAAAEYVDVFSTNYGADWNDGRIARFYFDSLHKLTGKPILVSEFYFAAMENRSGNRNTSGLFPTVKSQADRARSFRENLKRLAASPYVVGAHWFQYYDEPTYGRRDGEDFNMGLVDIHDRPYEELTAAATDLRAEAIHASIKVEPKESNGPVVLPAPSNPTTGLRDWNTDRMRIAPEPNPRPFAELYACWDERNVYLAAYVIDFAEKRLYRGETIPPSDRIFWTLDLGPGITPVKAWFGPADQRPITEPPVDLKVSRVSIRHTALLTLPAASFGKIAFKVGDILPLRVMLRSAGQAAQMSWNQRLQLTK
jgi:hypothetical protein